MLNSSKSKNIFIKNYYFYFCCWLISNFLLTNPNFLLTNQNFLLANPNFLLANPNFLLTNPNFLLTNPNFLLPNPNFLLNLDTNVKDGYECKRDGCEFWYRLELKDGYKCIASASRLDTNGKKDGYKCYDGLWIWYRLGFIVYLIWILMLRMDMNVVMDYEFDTGCIRFLF